MSETVAFCCRCGMRSSLRRKLQERRKRTTIGLPIVAASRNRRLFFRAVFFFFFWNDPVELAFELNQYSLFKHQIPGQLSTVRCSQIEVRLAELHDACHFLFVFSPDGRIFPDVVFPEKCLLSNLHDCCPSASDVSSLPSAAAESCAFFSSA